MIVPCEVAVKAVVPAVKARMAKELMEKHGFKQGKTARLLGISQSAVSKYTSEVRGHVIIIDNVHEAHIHIESMIALIVNGTYDRAEFLRLFCLTCRAIRREGLMCEWCGKSARGAVVNECSLCGNHNRRAQGSGRKSSPVDHLKKRPAR